MAEPGERNPVTPAEARAKARDAVARARRSIDRDNDVPNAEHILVSAFHDGASAVEMFKAIRDGV